MGRKSQSIPYSGKPRRWCKGRHRLSTAAKVDRQNRMRLNCYLNIQKCINYCPLLQLIQYHMYSFINPITYHSFIVHIRWKVIVSIENLRKRFIFCTKRILSITFVLDFNVDNHTIIVWRRVEIPDWKSCTRLGSQNCSCIPARW
jgi:hypothetical protein